MKSYSMKDRVTKDHKRCHINGMTMAIECELIVQLGAPHPGQEAYTHTHTHTRTRVPMSLLSLTRCQ